MLGCLVETPSLNRQSPIIVTVIIIMTEEPVQSDTQCQSALQDQLVNPDAMTETVQSYGSPADNRDIPDELLIIKSRWHTNIIQPNDPHQRPRAIDARNAKSMQSRGSLRWGCYVLAS